MISPPTKASAPTRSQRTLRHGFHDISRKAPRVVVYPGTSELDTKLDQPGIEVPLPGTGRFYVRLRATDADGFVGPYTAAQYFDVPNCLRDSSGGCVRSGEQTLNLGP